MSRTLEDDFDDDAPTGGLDLETGSNVGNSGIASSYGGEGIDFDDELYGDDAGGGGALELDIPGGSKHGPAPGSASSPARPQAQQHAPQPGPAGPAGAPVVPDLAFDAKPSRAPAAGSSGSLPAFRPSGPVPAARSSGAHSAAAPQMAPHSAAPPSSGRGLGGGPSAHPAPPAAPSDSGAYAPHSSTDRAPAASTSGSYAAQHGGSPAEPLPPPKPTAAAVIAKFPAPPTGIAHAPMYAARVVIRQLELRTDLESLRRRRSPDVPLYEAALKAYEPKTFRLGMAINIALLVVATFIFFLPVILRFMRAD